MHKEDKFIVINRKRFDELLASDRDIDRWLAKKRIRQFNTALDELVYLYEQTMGKKMDQEYIVCNQDEPYADKVWNIISSEGGADEV